MELHNYGNDLISADLKRLKKYSSLEKDLEIYLNVHKSFIEEFKNLSCKKASGRIENGDVYWLCKERVKLAYPKISESSGCRLWFLVLFQQERIVYIRILLYGAKEETQYTTSVCKRIIKKRLGSIGVPLS